MTNACSLSLSGLDVQACIGQMIEPITANFWWLQYWPWAVAAVGVYAAFLLLSKVKEVAGTPGVVTLLLGVVAVWENVRGRQGKGVLPTEWLPTQPAPAPAPKAPIPMPRKAR